MARPNRSLKTFALLAALAALMGVVATGCGTSDDDTDAKKDKGAETTEDGTSGEEATGDEAADESADAGDDEAAGDEAADESGDDSGDEPAEDEDA